MKKTRSQIAREVAHILSRKPSTRLRVNTGSAPSSLHWYSIGGEGEPWPAWLLALKTACGVYAIRDRSSGHVLYVGSSRKRLYDTVSRHFQQWRRKKNFWKGLHGAHHDPGMTYARGRCEVAIKTMACGAELDEEAALIGRLKPRDNLACLSG